MEDNYLLILGQLYIELNKMGLMQSSFNTFNGIFSEKATVPPMADNVRIVRPLLHIWI